MPRLTPCLRCAAEQLACGTAQWQSSLGSVRHDAIPTTSADGLLDRATSSFLAMHVATFVFLLIAALAVMLPFYDSSPDRRVYHPARRRAGVADRRARACGCCSLAIMTCALTIARNP